MQRLREIVHRSPVKLETARPILMKTPAKAAALAGAASPKAKEHGEPPKSVTGVGDDTKPKRPALVRIATDLEKVEIPAVLDTPVFEGRQPLRNGKPPTIVTD